MSKVTNMILHMDLCSDMRGINEYLEGKGQPGVMELPEEAYSGRKFLEVELYIMALNHFEWKPFAEFLKTYEGALQLFVCDEGEDLFTEVLGKEPRF